MISDSLKIALPVSTVILIIFAIYWIFRCKWFNRQLKKDNNNSIPSNRVNRNISPIILNSISIQDQQPTENKFKVYEDNDYKKITYTEDNLITFCGECIAQADSSYISKTCMYFEIEIVNLVEGSELQFGYTRKSFNILNNGIMFNFITDQILINNIEYNRAYINDLKSGDIIGCLYDNTNKEFTFTYNGNDINNTNCDLGAFDIYPTIYSTKGNQIKFKLGKSVYLYQRANLLKHCLPTNYKKEIPPSYEQDNSTPYE